MIARVYATHKKQFDETFGMSSRTASGVTMERPLRIVQTASITISNPIGINHSLEVPVEVLGGSPQIGDEFEVFFERKRK